ncbi:MAG TPA: DUF1643 domain-containing protein [Spirochaetota bacterium]|nr:DUF1643 domain-containing protein [Spirochaetota bacterium]
MKKPVYNHPDFVIKKADKRIVEQNKRLWLTLTIDETKKESIIVILKNPSRATKDISDKTVYTVSTYIHRNRLKFKQFKKIGTVIILNLIPYYETYSEKHVSKDSGIIDKANLKTIEEFTSKHKTVIVAWGDHPKGLMNEYEELKNTVLQVLKKNKNDLYYVDKLSKKGNPKHGQVWGYDDLLHAYKLI